MRQTRATHRHIHTQREWDQMHTNAPATPKPSTRMWASMRYNYTKNQKPFTSSVHTTQRQIHTWMYVLLLVEWWKKEVQLRNDGDDDGDKSNDETWKWKTTKTHSKRSAHEGDRERVISRDGVLTATHSEHFWEFICLCSCACVCGVHNTEQIYTSSVWNCKTKKKNYTILNVFLFFLLFLFFGNSYI